jgi:hypothetical protein
VPAEERSGGQRRRCSALNDWLRSRRAWTERGSLSTSTTETAASHLVSPYAGIGRSGVWRAAVRGDRRPEGRWGWSTHTSVAGSGRRGWLFHSTDESSTKPHLPKLRWAVEQSRKTHISGPINQERPKLICGEAAWLMCTSGTTICNADWFWS